jgi:gas vesicle protein
MRVRHYVSVARLLSAIVLAAALAAPAAAQSLGDLAKQEEARRKALKKPGKVLTADSIRATTPSSASVPAPASSPAADSSKASDAPADKTPKPADDPKAQEASWRLRMQGARDALQRSQVFAEALQSRLNGLTTDFASRDDPAQRAAVANNRDKALAELNRVKNEIVQQTKAIADIQDEARKAGVPPGWVR